MNTPTRDIEYEMELLANSNDPADRDRALQYYQKQQFKMNGKPSEKSNPKTFSAMSFDDLLDQPLPEIKYIVDQLIPETGLHLLLGTQKMGKSWIILQLAQSVACGGHAFGKIKVDQKKVLLMAIEDGATLCHRRAEQLGFTKTENHLFIIDSIDRKETPDPVHALDVFLEQNPDVRLVLIDTLQYFIGFNDLNDYAKVVNSLKVLREVARKRNVSIITTHHTRKAGNNESGDFTERALGSQGLAATCDTVILLSRGRQERRADLNVTGREILEKTCVLQFDPDCGWTLEGDKREVIEGDTQKLIYDWLKENGANSPTAIYKGLKEDGYTGAFTTVKTILSRMVKAGKLTTMSGIYTISVPQTSVNPVVRVVHDNERRTTETTEMTPVSESSETEKELEIY